MKYLGNKFVIYEVENGWVIKHSNPSGDPEDKDSSQTYIVETHDLHPDHDNQDLVNALMAFLKKYSKTH